VHVTQRTVMACTPSGASATHAAPLLADATPPWFLSVSCRCARAPAHLGQVFALASADGGASRRFAFAGSAQPTPR
jgi:hypothetical protein